MVFEDNSGLTDVIPIDNVRECAEDALTKLQARKILRLVSPPLVTVFGLLLRWLGKPTVAEICAIIGFVLEVYALNIPYLLVGVSESRTNVLVSSFYQKCGGPAGI